MKINIKTVNTVSYQEWDELVQHTYGKMYCIQQQDGCKDRGVEKVRVPEYDWVNDYENGTIVPVEVNGKERGVSFQGWLDADEMKFLEGEPSYCRRLWMHRNFYPDVSMVANDLFEKGLLPAGELWIDIDW